MMYDFFNTYEGDGVPSFTKFARSIGLTFGELEGFKCYKGFEKAWRDCGEIRRDYLIDKALCKRYDSSFTKFLIQYEFGEAAETLAETGKLNVTLEVINK